MLFGGTRKVSISNHKIISLDIISDKKRTKEKTKKISR